MRIAIFTSPIVDTGFFVTETLQKADKIFAADCGASVAVAMGITPETVIGDFDSLTAATIQELKKKGVAFVQTAPEKDETDTELAIAYAITQGATEISLVGGIGGSRFEHAIANIALTYNSKIPIAIVNGPSKLWVLLGPQNVSIVGEKDDLLSLLPLSQVVTNIKTEGLCYPLLDEPLYFGKPRGMSNVFAEKKAFVSFSNGLLLFVHSKKK